MSNREKHTFVFESLLFTFVLCHSSAIAALQLGGIFKEKTVSSINEKKC
jgi:hypothetical protein